MLDRVVVDFARTFGQPGIFLGIEPKMTRSDKNDPKSEMVQGREKDGNGLKWTVTIAVKIANFDRVKTENLSITLTSPANPCAALQMGQPVVAEGLEMGVMKQEKSGFSQFFTATAIKPVAVPAQRQ
jgi:hypothetical protein